MGCASNANKYPLREPVTRTLPNPPTYLAPVPLPKVRPGDNALVVIKERGQIVRRQNSIISEARKWYEGVKTTYSVSPVPKNRLFGF
jgi:hypothetical protein